MQEPNENQTATQPKQEICNIRIMFPVASDDEAIGYKKKITDMLSSNPDAVINFSIISGRPSGPMK